jgi:hypothetical protein
MVVKRTGYLPVVWRGTFENRAGASRVVKKPGDVALVERGCPRWLVFACPCGCGEELPVNLDPRAGPAWRMYRSTSGVSVYPSVWRDTDCESHFIVWRDEISLFGAGRDFDEDSALVSQPLATAVLDELPADVVRGFEDVAAALGLVPWDVLDACRKLVRQGAVVEGQGRERTKFRRK